MLTFGMTVALTIGLTVLAIARQVVRQIQTGQREPISSIVAIAVLFLIVLLVAQVAVPPATRAVRWIQLRAAELQ